MALKWSDVTAKYGSGYNVPTITGGKFLHVASADDEAINIDSPIWTARIERQHLEKAARLIDDGLIATDPGLFVEDYMLYVSLQRATSVAHIMRDLGFLDETETFSVRC